MGQILMNKNYFFTSESVSEGHPDKVCDQVSDAVLDAMLTQDPMSRVACECYATTGMILVGGEITTETYIDLQETVRNVIREIGYNEPKLRFDADSVAVLNTINHQSENIKIGVDTGGAGDQGLMFGFANKETEELMPAPIMFAHKLMKKLSDIRKTTNLMPYLKPDAKSQVTVEYNENDEIVRIDTIVISTQHEKGISQEEIKEDIKNILIKQVIPEHLIDERTKLYVNPTGLFEIGGPHGDTGLTGRKIIVDTYGGKAPHGGGSFSGKDPTKVDRSAAYAARHLAKNIVAAGLSDECLIQLSYAIGIAQPVSIYTQTKNLKNINNSELSNFIINNIDLTPNGIIKKFDLRRPIYQQTAAYGHFGRNEFPWEKLDLVDLFKQKFL
jgi:S-adenosylmethionine synthetase